MLIRISLIVAVLGGLAVAGINFAMLKSKIETTITDRNTYHTNWKREEGEHAKFEKLAKETQVTLDKTKGQLASMTDERNQARTRADEEGKRANELADNLKKTTQELGTTRDKLARWEGLGPIEQVRATIQSVNQVKADIENVTSENKIFYARSVRLQNKLDEILTPSQDGPALPEGLIGKVLAVDPKYDFVVLDIGEKEGVQENGQMLVNHNGKLVAKVRITDSIQPNRCIANVMPGWNLGDIMEGDQVLTLR